MLTNRENDGKQSLPTDFLVEQNERAFKINEQNKNQNDFQHKELECAIVCFQTTHFLMLLVLQFNYLNSLLESEGGIHKLGTLGGGGYTKSTCVQGGGFRTWAL